MGNHAARSRTVLEESLALRHVGDAPSASNLTILSPSRTYRSGIKLDLSRYVVVETGTITLG